MSHERFVYSACGLSLVSDAAIPGLHRIDDVADADVTISIHAQAKPAAWTGGSPWYVSSGVDPAGRPEVSIEANDEAYRVTYCDDTTFVLDRAGRHVNVRWSPAVAGADAAGYLTSYVLAFVLRLRRSVPLHASAVAVSGRALLFVGDSWSGKSSTAAAFSTLGHPILSDDIVRIDAAAGGLVAYPSHPRVNVWSDSAAALYSSGELPLHGDTSGKHALDLVDAGFAFQPTPAPIAAIYVLGPRSATGQPPATRPLAPREALMALVDHAYGSAFLDPAMRASEFDALCRLVNEVPVRELRFGDDLGTLVSSCRVLALRSTGQEGPAQHT